MEDEKKQWQIYSLFIGIISIFSDEKKNRLASAPYVFNKKSKSKLIYVSFHFANNHKTFITFSIFFFR